MITGLAHVNLNVPDGTLDQAKEFYSKTLGLKLQDVPEDYAHLMAWFDIGESGQQIHISFGTNEPGSYRHPCFRIESEDALGALRQRIWDHHQRGGPAAPLEADKPREQVSGHFLKGGPRRFFTRDYAGNRLEFSL